MGKRSRRKRLLWLAARKGESHEEEPSVASDQKPTSNDHRGFFHRTYEDHYKNLMLITMGLLILSLAYIGGSYAFTGEWIKKDISLKGGVSLTVISPKDLPLDQVNKHFSERFPDADIAARKFATGLNKGYIIEGSDLNDSALVPAAEALFGPLTKDQYSVETMGSSLGSSFFRETGVAIILAFVFMSLVVLITFRNLVPSLFCILAAFSTIIETFTVTQLLGVRISTAGIAAFLMLIGYSIDTDILLTTRVLKREEGTIFFRTVGALKTGITMSLTAFAATLIGFFLGKSSTLIQIFLILSIGLIFDILNTWLQNAGILRWYLERKKV